MQDLFNPDVDTIREFLTRWYGPPQRSQGIEVQVHAPVPMELTTWHYTISAWDHPIAFQDHPVPLAKLRVQSDGMMVFWIEAQGGYVWAVNLASATHGVSMADPGDGIWTSTGLALTDFLNYVTLREAILGSENKVFAPSLPLEYAQEVVQEFVPSGLVSRAGPGFACRLHIGVDALAEVSTPPSGYPDGPQDVMLILAAISNDALQRHMTKIDPRYLAWGNPSSSGVENVW